MTTEKCVRRCKVTLVVRIEDKEPVGDLQKMADLDQWICDSFDVDAQNAGLFLESERSEALPELTEYEEKTVRTALEKSNDDLAGTKDALRIISGRMGVPVDTALDVLHAMMKKEKIVTDD